MTRIGDNGRPRRPQERTMPHWLAFGITAGAFSAPIAVLILLAWPLLSQRTIVILDDFELICSMAAAAAIGTILAIRLHYRRAIS